MLKQRAIAATAWSGADILLRQGLQFAVTIALARLLTPEEFGTIALLSLFTAIAGVLIDGGLSTALIQRQDVSHADESTTFWLNLGVGALVATGLWLLAPAIAAFFDQPILVPLMIPMSLTVFVGALGAIHGTLLTKRLDFRTQLWAGATATMLSGLVGVTMAWKGFGAWALATQALVATATNTVLLWALHSWRPTATFSVASIRRLAGFGAYLLLANLLDVAYGRLYILLLGRMYGVRELGFYNRADSTKQLAVGTLTSILSRVALPMLSAASDEAQLRRGLRLAIRGTMLVNVPMMLGLAAVSEPLVLTLFGAKWLPAVRILQVCSLAGLLWPLHVINVSAMLAAGQSRLILRLQLVKAVLGIGLLVAGSLHGVLGIAWSQVAFGALAFLINARYAGRILGYGPAAQVRDFLPAVALALPMAVAVVAAGRFWEAAPAMELLGLTLLGALAFLALGWLLRVEALHDLTSLLRQAASQQEPKVA